MTIFEKIERWFFYFLIFFLPWQTRIIFKSWGSGFNEWNSAAFYLTDALLAAVIFLWLVRIFSKKTTVKFGKIEFALFVFLGFAALSLFKAENFWLGAFREMKLIEFGLLFLYIKNNLSVVFNLEKIYQLIVLSGGLQALIAIGQFVRQKSFGLSFLDESPLSQVISGVAKIVVHGEKLIRPYGLTPHPNVLAVFLLLAIFCVLALFTRKNKDYRWGAAVFYALATAILTFAFFITFSRSVIAIGLVAIFGWLVYLCFKKGGFTQSSRVILTPPWRGKDLSRMRAAVARIRGRFLGLRPRNDNQTRKSWVSRKWYFLNTIVILGVCCLLTAILLWPYLSARFDIESGLADQSLNLRVFYSQVALNFIAKHPLLGVGIGNFVWTFQNSYNLAETWMYQPVHNIYLLIAAETGLLGLLAFLVFVFFAVKAKFYSLSLSKGKILAQDPSTSPPAGGFAQGIISGFFLFLFFSFLLLGLFDHLLWDLQQGQLMLWMVLGMLASFSPYGSTDPAPNKPS